MVIKFPLKMADEAQVRSIEELREHFDLATVLEYYTSGRLLDWLSSRYYDEEADMVSKLDSSSADFKKSLCEALGVPYSEEEASRTNLDDISQKNERREMLKKYTADDAVLAAVDRVAFTQDELMDLLNKGEKEIYLCGGEFIVPVEFENVTYIGINDPEIELSGEISGKNIVFRDVDSDTPEYVSAEANLDDISQKNERREMLKKYTADDTVLAAADRVAFTQDELLKLLEKGEKEIYLCGDVFTVFARYENVTYIGVNNPIIEMSGDFAFRDIWFKNIDMLIKNLKDVLDSENPNPEMIRKIKTAAENGNPDAQYRLGNCYYLADAEKAVKWYEKAAEQGHAEAQYRLGKYYWNGEEAIKWYEKAAEQGHAEAQYQLGEFYYFGDGVEEDQEEAVKWYKKAGEQGHAKAQYQLGECYYLDGVEKDQEEAVKWLKKAAEQGEFNSQLLLGDCYYTGNGVEGDEKEAVKWYKKSAEQGHQTAQYRLGICYNFGYGVEKNEKEAVKWLKKAAEQGYEEAIELLEKLGYDI